MDLSSRNALAAATLAVLAFSASALAADIKQSGEQHDMKLVGHADLQGRGSYQPNFIQYPDGRIARLHSDIQSAFGLFYRPDRRLLGGQLQAESTGRSLED